MELSKCEIGSAIDEQKCSVVYCNGQHQNETWNKHKLISCPYKLEIDPILGRHLVALRKIKSGEIIIREAPLISGPSQMTAPVCLGTCGRLVKPPALLPCELCGWPLCGAEKCKNSRLHEPECTFTRNRGSKISISNYVFPHPNYQCLTVLRMLYQRDNNKQLWEKFMKLQSHFEDLKNTDKYENDRTSIAGFIHRFFKLENTFSEEEIMKVCGILQVNGHEVPLSDPPFVAIYEQSSMLEHNCRPNCSKSFTSDSELLIHAAVDIEAGSHLSISYTDSLWGTSNRRHFLFETKCFACNCKRCSDPTEFQTYFSALKCTKTDCNGYMLPKTFLVDPKSNLNSIWQCSCLCGNTFASNIVENILERIGHDLSAMKKGDMKCCKLFLDYYGKVLHPNHFYLTDVRLAFAQIIGQNTENGLNSVTDEDIEQKIKNCNKLTNLLQILCPAEVRVRGTILFELHAGLAEIAKRRASSKQASPEEFKAILMRSREALGNAVDLLQHEPRELPEGRICAQAQINLQNMDEVLRTLHTNLGDVPI